MTMRMRTLAGLCGLALLALSLGAQEAAEGKGSTKLPAGWKEEQPTNAMRFAQYKLTKVPGDDADAELVVFKGLGGSADAKSAALTQPRSRYGRVQGSDFRGVFGGRIG